MYGDSTWRDKLTSYNGNAITYDTIGNPTSYKGYTLDWSNGRELTSLSGNGLTATYTYDASGLRTEKIVNGTKTEYEYVDGKLMYEKKGDIELHYSYDGNGVPIYIQYVKADGTTGAGTLITNNRGDVVGILNTSGVLIVNYTYDAWGNVLSVKNQNGVEITSAGHIGNMNSLRHRGYYYDIDTKMYYLQSRYYDPEVKRFINADDVSVLEEDQGSIIENNLFAYCLNNPINSLDEDGKSTIVLGGGIVWAVKASGMIASVAFAPATMIVVGSIAVGAAGYAGYKYYKVKNSSKKAGKSKVKQKKKTKNKNKKEGHRTTKNGSKKRLNDKHTKKRAGSQKDKAKQKGSWVYRGNKKKGPKDYTP